MSYFNARQKLKLARSLTTKTSPTYVQFDPFTVKGALYRPADSRATSRCCSYTG